MAVRKRPNQQVELSSAASWQPAVNVSGNENVTVKNQITNFSSYRNFTANYRQNQKQNSFSTCILVTIRIEQNLIYCHYTINNEIAFGIAPQL